MRAPLRLLLALLVALSLAATACTDSDDGGDAADGSGNEQDEPRDDEPTDDSDDDDEPTDDEDDPDDDDEDDERADIGLDLDEIGPTVAEDLEVYWAETMPAVYGTEYEPLSGGLFPYDSEELPPTCGGEGGDYESNAFNAFYCAPDDLVAWDTEQLWPTLAEEFGGFAIAMVMAHEWGHVVQARSGLFGTVDTIVTELQADCFAGSWASWVYEGNSDLVEMGDDAFGQALGGLIFVRDAPGTAASDPFAHGSGFDRIGAFQEGFELGAARCAEYDVDLPPLPDLQFLDATDYELGGNLPLDDLLPLLLNDFNATFAAIDASFVPIDDIVLFEAGSDDVPSCDGDLDDPDDQVEAVLPCFDDNIVAADADYIEELHGEIGDGAVAAVLGMAWGVMLLAQLDAVPADAFEVVSAGACLTGAWTADVFLRDPTAVPEGFIAGLSPGDLDEMILAYASFVEDAEPEAGIVPFLLVGELRSGFLEGAGACG